MVIILHEYIKYVKKRAGEIGESTSTTNPRTEAFSRCIIHNVIYTTTICVVPEITGVTLETFLIILDWFLTHTAGILPFGSWVAKNVTTMHEKVQVIHAMLRLNR